MMNKRKIGLIKKAIDLTLERLMIQINNEVEDLKRDKLLMLIEEYLEVRKELKEHIGGRPKDRE